MRLAINDGYLPVKLTASPMADEEFAAFCAEYPDYFVEMTAQGEIVIKPLNHTLASAANAYVMSQLEAWATRDGRGAVTDASGGFLLPDGARLAPDAAWTVKDRVRELSAESLRAFWRLCPDFVIELRSQSDRLPVLRQKMQEWIENGAQLAWLIDPERKAVEIYRPGQQPESRIGIETIAGEIPVEGFTLDLRPVWDPMAF